MKDMLTLILILTVVLSAAFVDKNRAQKVAENYYRNYCSEAAVEIGGNAVNVHVNKLNGRITRYIIEFKKGFVMLPSDDRFTPILGYSDHGEVPDPEKAGGENFKNWFNAIDALIGCTKSKDDINYDVLELWNNYENNIFPKVNKGIIVDRLVDTIWGQERPWNNLCPIKEDHSTYSGCIANTGSMIMNYHHWPPSGIGSNSYNWFNGTDSIPLTENFTNYSFNYDLMVDEVNWEFGLYPEYWESTNCSQQELDEMAKISYLFGISVNMNFGNIEDNSSTSTMSKCLDAYNNNWDYTATIYNIGTVVDPTTSAVLIQSELDAKRPLHWSGGVHSFILDGYRDDYWYHFNWGWEGTADGWFQLNSLVPLPVGSCGFNTDFTSNQVAITVVPDTDLFASYPIPENFSGQLQNGEDVQLTWIKPSTGDPESYNIYKSIDSEKKVLYANTTSLSFVENDLPEGAYTYSLNAVYVDGESHLTNAYTANVVEVEQYLKVDDLTATVVGRTNIDLEWVIPFTGVILETENFENGFFDASWVQKTSTETNGDMKAPTDWWEEDLNDDITINSAINIVERGYYACTFSTSAEENLWLFTPEFTFDSGSFIRFWTRFRYGDGAGGTQNTRFSVVAYTGLFDEKRDCEYDVIGTWDSSVDPVNEWDSQWEVSLSALDGQTKRVGFCVPVNGNDYYTFALDDILIGSYDGGISEAPTGYEIYRNSLLTETINNDTTETWSDTGFTDGDNEYYIKVLYPTGQSISSDKVIALMDGNPAPDYLTGIFNGNDVDLNWYMPYGTPPHWTAYIDPQNCTATVDYLADTDCARRRVEFHAEDLGLYYPVTIDSIAAGFYEWQEEPWNGDTFIIRLWDGHPTDGGILLWESSTMTATSGTIFTVGLPQSYVLNNEWNVEVEALDGTTGHPATLAGPSSSGINSYFYYTLESSYNYYISSNGAPLDYCLLAYVTGGDPDPIVKSGWTVENQLVEKLPIIDKRERTINDLKISGKGLDCYNIYRNDEVIGTSMTTSYTDYSLEYGIYTYYVTASYVNPVGESERSNEVTIYPPPGPDPFYTSVELTVAGSLITITWEALASATDYDVYFSSDPYGTFTFVGSTTDLFLETTVPGDKGFYYVRGTNDWKEPEKEIKVDEVNLK